MDEGQGQEQALFEDEIVLQHGEYETQSSVESPADELDATMVAHTFVDSRENHNQFVIPPIYSPPFVELGSGRNHCGCDMLIDSKGNYPIPVLLLPPCWCA